MQLILNIQNLTFTYPYSLKPILNNISFKIEKGEIIGLLGANGCGKSTLLKLLIKELVPSSGKFYEKDNITIAYIAQDMAQILFMDLTLQENLRLLKVYFSSQEEMSLYLAQYHKKLPLYIDQPVKMLSGGEKQALALAAKLYHKPDLLLLDEHTSALDPEAEKGLMALTYQEIKEQKITTLMCTHKLDLAQKYSTRIIGLNKGKISVDLLNSNNPFSKEFLEKIYL